MGVSAGWCALAISALAYLHLSDGLREPFHEGVRHLNFFDLKVYRGAALRMTRDWALYSRPIRLHLGFTYPPAAALLMVPLGWLPIRGDEVAITALNLLLLVWLLRRTLMIARPSLRVSRAGVPLSILADRGIAWSLGALAAAFAIWLEPVSVALGYGQVDIIITALVILDISMRDDARAKGVAIGLAAGVKLTPLLFIPYLFLSGRRRAAGVATATFATTVAASFALVPRDAARYWGSMVFQTNRIGAAADVANQSLRGAIARLLHVWHPGAGATVTVAIVAVIGIWLAVRASRGGDEATGFALCAVTTLLASPVSWTHHWVLVVPAVLLLVLVGCERRSLPMLGAAALLSLVGYAYLPEQIMTRGYHMHSGNPLRVDPYTVLALLTLCLAAAGAALESHPRFVFATPNWRRLTRRPVRVSA